MIVTPRLTLISATLAHVRAEIDDRTEFARLLQADVPDNWPPESAADALPLFLTWLEAAPQHAGWFGWYALARDHDHDHDHDHDRKREREHANPPRLVGGGGFLGPPQDGAITLGYAVLPQFQQQGFATEMTRGLIQWAFGDPSVSRIMAETEWANPASVRVLTKLGFTAIGPSPGAGSDADSDTGGMRFELVNPRDQLDRP